MSELLLLTQDYPPRPGGMARYYGDLAAGLGEACTVFTGGWEKRPPMKIGQECHYVLPFDADRSHRFWNLRKARTAVRSTVDRTRPRALLVGNVRPYGSLGVSVARETGIPLIVLYHGNDLLRTARRWRGSRWKRGRWTGLVTAPAIHVVNSAFTLETAAGLGLPRDRLAVVPPEVDTTRFRPARDEAERNSIRAELGAGPEDRVSLFVGRLVERKGLGDLFEAAGRLAERTRIWIAGPGDPAPWRRRAEGVGLNSVEFLGSVSETMLPRLYRAADCFVSPSRHRLRHDDVEGFGIVYLEAAASGCPILAARVGGVPEAVEENVGGLLVDAESPEGLARHWDRLLGDPDLRRRLGAGGRSGRAVTHGPGSSAAALRAAMDRLLGPGLPGFV